MATNTLQVPFTQLTPSPLQSSEQVPLMETQNHGSYIASSLGVPLAQMTPTPVASATQLPSPASATPTPASVDSGTQVPPTVPASAGNHETERPRRRTRRRRTLARAARGSGFTRVEVDGLLDLLEVIKPIGRDEWETVARRHNEKHPGVDRTVESLRRKFSKLYRTQMGTGNPHMPNDVARAIQISTAMAQRADLARGDDIAEDGAELFEDDDESAADDDDDMSVHATNSVTPAGRPLVLPRESSGNGDDLLSLARLMMLQEQRQREVDREQQQRWREEDRRQREEDRRQREEDRRQREQDRAEGRERSNRLFELLAMAMMGVAKTVQSNKEAN